MLIVFFIYSDNNPYEMTTTRVLVTNLNIFHFAKCTRRIFLFDFEIACHLIQILFEYISLSMENVIDYRFWLSKHCDQVAWSQCLILFFCLWLCAVKLNWKIMFIARWFFFFFSLFLHENNIILAVCQSTKENNVHQQR